MDDKYLHYELSDYLEDDVFIREIRTGHKDKEEWQKMLEDKPSELKVYHEAVLIISSIKFKAENISGERVDSLWEGIRGKATQRSKTTRRTLIRILGLSGIAAAIALLLFFVNVYSKDKQINAIAGEHVEQQLPDESIVKINAESSIRFNKKDFISKRELSMKGEVFFKIEKGSPFIVTAPLGKIQVLGTSFNVYSRDSLFNVACYEGKVMVVSSRNDTAFLSKNESISYDLRKRLKVENKFDSDEIKDWTNGVFKYDNQRLDLIFKEVERQFNVQLNVESGILSSEKHYTGMFKNDDLNKALYDICWPMHLSYEIDGNQINIKAQQ